MANAHGTAILTFDADAQAAHVETTQVVNDSAPNPHTWTLVSSIAASYRYVFSGGGLLVASSNTTIAATSPDGVTWTQRVLPSGTWDSGTYGNGMYVLVSKNSAIIATSPSGTTWTSRAVVGGSTAYDVGVAYGNGTFVAADSATVAATSTDGITWTPQTKPSGGKFLIFGGGVFVLSGNSTTVLTSTNGITWTPRTITNSGWNSGAYGNGTFVLISNTNGTNLAATSTDGITWTPQTLPFTSNWKNLAFGDGRFFATDNSAIGAVSYDGISWAPIDYPPSGNPPSAGFGGGAFITVNTNVIHRGLLTNVRTFTNVNTEVSPYKPVVGSNVATVTVTGQATLLATDHIDAWIQGSDSTASHNAYEHKIAPIKLAIMNVVAGVGFDIVGLSEHRLDGTFKVRWAWAT